jgi:hypothetical protein
MKKLVAASVLGIAVLMLAASPAQASSRLGTGSDPGCYAAPDMARQMTGGLSYSGHIVCHQTVSKIHVTIKGLVYDPLTHIDTLLVIDTMDCGAGISCLATTTSERAPQFGCIYETQIKGWVVVDGTRSAVAIDRETMSLC